MGKTVKNWLFDLPEKYRDRALKYLIEENQNYICYSLPEALNRAFQFDKTPEGYEFWFNVYNYYCKPNDPIIEKVITEFRERSERGISKYGTTLADSPEDMAARLQHLKEELMDALNYIAWIQSNRQQ